MDMLDNGVIFLKIVIINMLLSGDNAIVIAMAGRRLPPAQRRKAVWWGAVAAIALRCVLTIGAIALLHVPFLQTAGALLLLGIALQLLLERDAAAHASKPAATLAGAVWTIVIADFVMSLDNVLAVAAVANGDTVMLVLGIVMSVPIIIWGSSFIMRALDKMPWLSYAGGALLGYTAAEMLLKDPGLKPFIAALGDKLLLVFPYAVVAVLIMSALLLRARGQPS